MVLGENLGLHVCYANSSSVELHPQPHAGCVTSCLGGALSEGHIRIRPGLHDTKEDSDTYGHLLLCVKTRNTSDNI